MPMQELPTHQSAQNVPMVLTALEEHHFVSHALLIISLCMEPFSVSLASPGSILVGTTFFLDRVSATRDKHVHDCQQNSLYRTFVKQLSWGFYYSFYLCECQISEMVSAVVSRGEASGSGPSEVIPSLSYRDRNWLFMEMGK